METVNWNELSERLLTAAQRHVFEELCGHVSHTAAFVAASKAPAFYPSSFDTLAANLNARRA